ncbi:hypothetical protein BJ875DRAFT_470709 [Amylocarpus encephaloides]|uniref:Uncharacterized protein n=1 Tax=Amylocarpus encephaloides TaxID=45428 RepID=A0A9P8C214_9HELO|nr:hypothetical protein BJ875DRAFT_470709 [Amylocarpus encephaloides]
MVVSTPISRNGSFFERTKQWDPLKALGILNTDIGYQCITCIGYAPSQRRRCQNPIRQDNRQFITTTLNEIAYLSSDSPIVISKLQAIAGPALCVRYHQVQASTILMQWKAAIRLAKPQINNTRYQDQEEDRQGEEHGKQRQERERERHRRDERARATRRQENKRPEKERAKKERQEEKRVEMERAEKEQAEKEQAAAHSERIRQKAQQAREERERVRKAKQQMERQEWDQRWTRYQRCWAQFRASETRDRDSIPWPVKSGAFRDVKAPSAKEFLKRAVPEDASMAKLMRQECRNWHPDTVYRLISGERLSAVD